MWAECRLWLIPAPAFAPVPVAAAYPTVAAGCAAIEAVLACGVVPATVEYLDAGALAAAGASFPGGLLPGARFLVVCEADGGEHEVAELLTALGPGARKHASRELWRWRGGVSIAVTAAQGGKLSEDIAVPLDRLAEGILGTVEIGVRHRLDACSWGHAGDGNLHSTFLLTPGDHDQLARAEAATEELFALAVALGGTISGEHGLGWLKRGAARPPVGPGRARRTPCDQGRAGPRRPVQPREEECLGLPGAGRRLADEPPVVLVRQQRVDLRHRDPAPLVDLVVRLEALVGDDGHRPPADALRAALAVDVLVVAQLAPQLTAQARLLVDLAEGRRLVRFAAVELALGQRPVLIAWSVDDADCAVPQNDTAGGLDEVRGEGGHQSPKRAQAARRSAASKAKVAASGPLKAPPSVAPGLTPSRASSERRLSTSTISASG